MNDNYNIGLDYNTQREKLTMPEYGRNVLKMIEKLKEIPDRDKRSEQARAVVKVMETLNPQVHAQDNFEHKIKATHYGRNIEKIINLLCEVPDGEAKEEMLRCLAIYMRQQYLIWNKDSVADETIFSDIEKLSDYRIKVPDTITLSKISGDANFSRPGMGINVGQPGGQKNGGRMYRNNRRQNKKK